MLRNLLLVVSVALLLSVGACGETPKYGTAEEARALLEKAVAAVKADKEAALAAFNSKEPPYTDRDLYVFCANASDGVTTAHPVNKGQSIKDFKDVKGFAFGAEILNTASEGTISEITYMWPRPGSDEPVEKISYFTKVGDQICGLGYYK